MNLSAGRARRRPIDGGQTDGERDERAHGAERERHEHDEQVAEQDLPCGVAEPGEVQERSDDSEQDDQGRPNRTRVQEQRRQPEIDQSGS